MSMPMHLPNYSLYDPALLDILPLWQTVMMVILDATSQRGVCLLITA